MTTATPSPEAVDLLCVRDPRPAAAPAQDLDFELVVSYARGRDLTVATVGYPDSGLSAPDLPTALAAFRPRFVYAHLPSRQALHRWRAAEFPYGAAEQPHDGRGTAENPETPPVLAGGDFAGRHGEAILDCVAGLDAVVRGEPEATVAAVARASGDWLAEAGLTVRGVAGAPRHNPPRPLLDDLEPLTAHLEDFHTRQRGERGQKVLVSRGCNSDCQYCGLQTPYRTEHSSGRHAFWRSRRAEDVVAEIARFYARGVRRFHLNSFVTFGYDEAGSRQVEGIARGILDRGLELELRFVTLVRDLVRNLHLLPLLRRAGLAQVVVGIDSGLPRALSLYRVDQSPEQARRCLEALARVKIPFFSSFIFYDPYLTLAEVRHNLEFLGGLRPFYRHMELPFSYFLDQQLLGTVLRVRTDIPVHARLVEDGLAEMVDPLEGEPRVGMRHPEVGRLFQTHQAASRALLPKIRPLLFSRRAVDRFGDLETLPLDLVDHLADIYEARPDTDPPAALKLLGQWLHRRLAPRWDEMVGTLDLAGEELERLRAFPEQLVQSTKVA